MAVALATGTLTLRECANQFNLHENTIRIWVNQPSFADRIRQLRTEMTERALGRLIDGMTTAANQLRHLSMCGQSETVRLNASCKLIELTAKLREQTEFEARLRALEQRATGVPLDEPPHPVDPPGEERPAA